MDCCFGAVFVGFVDLTAEEETGGSLGFTSLPRLPRWAGVAEEGAPPILGIGVHAAFDSGECGRSEASRCDCGGGGDCGRSAAVVAVRGPVATLFC